MSHMATNYTDCMSKTRYCTQDRGRRTSSQQKPPTSTGNAESSAARSMIITLDICPGDGNINNLYVPTPTFQRAVLLMSATSKRNFIHCSSIDVRPIVLRHQSLKQMAIIHDVTDYSTGPLSTALDTGHFLTH